MWKNRVYKKIQFREFFVGQKSKQFFPCLNQLKSVQRSILKCLAWLKNENRWYNERKLMHMKKSLKNRIISFCQ
jgi:hypothetical protein